MMRRLIMAGAVLLVGMCGAVQAQQAPKIYNTAKQKLLDGKQVVGGTVFSPIPRCTAPWRMPDSIFSGSRCSTAR